VTGKNGAVALTAPLGNTLRHNTESLGHFANIAQSPQRSKDVGKFGYRNSDGVSAGHA
jgi:hypothetical protein